MQFISGEPMQPSEIDKLLSLPDIVLGSVTWHKLIDRASDTVAEYEGVISGQKLFLHLKSYETTNYWIITWPDRNLKQDNGIKISDYDLSSITRKATNALQERQAKD